MSKGFSKKNRLSREGVASFIIFLCMATVVGATEDISWLEAETKYTVIRYQSPEDLAEFDKKVAYSPALSSSGLKWLFSQSGTKNPEDRLKNKVDALYRRVQEILGMRKKMDKVRINIYHDRRHLKDAFYSIYKKQGQHRAWYIFEFNTIYITIADLHEGMLAHENGPFHN